MSSTDDETTSNPSLTMTKPTGSSKPSSSSSGPSVDHMSPYYLHPSDSPGQNYVSEVLRDGNYGDWFSDMSTVLFAKNKIGFVDGSVPAPDPDSSDYLLWQRCDAMVRSWLHTAMDREIKNSIKHAKTAKEVWDDLAERFGKESAPRAYELKRTLSTTRQEGLSVSAYYTKLRGLWEEIQYALPSPKCTNVGGCGCDIQKQLGILREKEMLYEFLMGLDEVFAVVRTQILSTKPTPSLSTAYHLVSEDEKHRKIAELQRPVIETPAFQVSTM